MSVRRRGKKWEVRVDLGPDPSTGRRRTWSATCNTKREGIAAEAAKRREVDEGIAVERSRQTVAEFLALWLSTVKGSVGKRTYANHDAHARLHLVPAIGSLELQKLTTLRVQQLVNDLRDKKLAPGTVVGIHATLHRALVHAVALRLVIQNASTGVTLPRIPPRPMQVWTAEQVAAFLTASAAEREGALWALTAGTGMRLGEVLGLCWRDVDLDARSLRVRQAVGAQGGLSTGEPKSPAARRTIALDASVLAALRWHRARQDRERELIGAAWEDRDLVFATPSGGISHPSTVSAHFASAVKRHGLPHIRYHDLRHTHATLLLRRGVNVKVVSERLGHASVVITLSTYAHVLPDMQSAAADAWGRLIWGAAENPGTQNVRSDG